MQLGPGARSAGFAHRHAEAVGSTNADVLAEGRDRFWLTADRQTAGRGRRGRSWTSEPGNVYASLLLRNPAPPRECSQLCFVAALAVSDGVRAAAPVAGGLVRLKWPNDVLVDGAKVAGILIEASHGAGGLAVAIGCGINVAHHPEDVPYAATHLAVSDPWVGREAIFQGLSDGFASRLAQWDEGRGFSSIRRDWLTLAAGLGAPIVVRLPGGETEGVFEALDEDGNLVLREASGARRAIAAGEVFFPSVISESEAGR